MGRKKSRKPRRPRVPRQYTLQELRPPGEGYEEWFRVTAGIDPEQIDDPRLDGEARALMKRLIQLGPLYGNKVPKAALYLDDLIDSGQLPIFGNDQEGVLMPVSEAAALFGSKGDLRESIHNLHAVGALLVDTDDEHDLAFIRMVAKRPEEPGQPWRFEGDPDAVTASTCIPNHIWEELPTEVAAAVAYQRTCRSRLEEPDPRGLRPACGRERHCASQEAVRCGHGVRCAVDEKGCEACPTGHLCTRTGN